MARLSPVHRDPTGKIGGMYNGILLSTSYTYDVYILVFRKGAAEHRFSFSAGEIPGLRDVSGAWGNATLLPSVRVGNWNAGVSSTTGAVINAVPAMGSFGIGYSSGTVFHQIVDSSYQHATPRPMLLGQSFSVGTPQEPVLYVPSADGNAGTASPLIYIYQTTLTF